MRATLASEKVTSWKLKAFKYYYTPLKEIGLGGIMVDADRRPNKAAEGTG